MIKALFVAGFLTLSTLTGYAQECVKLPVIQATETSERYTGEDAFRFSKLKGAPQGDEYVVILVDGTRTGTLYALSKGCIIGQTGITENRLVSLLNYLGVKRVSQRGA